MSEGLCNTEDSFTITGVNYIIELLFNVIVYIILK